MDAARHANDDDDDRRNRRYGIERESGQTERTQGANQGQQGMGEDGEARPHRAEEATDRENAGQDHEWQQAAEVVEHGLPAGKFEQNFTADMDFQFRKLFPQFIAQAQGFTGGVEPLHFVREFGVQTNARESETGVGGEQIAGQQLVRLRGSRQAGQFRFAVLPEIGCEQPPQIARRIVVEQRRMTAGQGNLTVTFAQGVDRPQMVEGENAFAFGRQESEDDLGCLREFGFEQVKLVEIGIAARQQ